MCWKVAVDDTLEHICVAVAVAGFTYCGVGSSDCCIDDTGSFSTYIERKLDEIESWLSRTRQRVQVALSTFAHPLYLRSVATKKKRTLVVLWLIGFDPSSPRPKKHHTSQGWCQTIEQPCLERSCHALTQPAAGLARAASQTTNRPRSARSTPPRAMESTDSTATAGGGQGRRRTDQRLRAALAANAPGDSGVTVFGANAPGDRGQRLRAALQALKARVPPTPAEHRRTCASHIPGAGDAAPPPRGRTGPTATAADQRTATARPTGVDRSLARTAVDQAPPEPRPENRAEELRDGRPRFLVDWTVAKPNRKPKRVVIALGHVDTEVYFVARSWCQHYWGDGKVTFQSVRTTGLPSMLKDERLCALIDFMTKGLGIGDGDTVAAVLRMHGATYVGTGSAGAGNEHRAKEAAAAAVVLNWELSQAPDALQPRMLDSVKLINQAGLEYPVTKRGQPPQRQSLRMPPRAQQQPRERAKLPMTMSLRP